MSEVTPAENRARGVPGRMRFRERALFLGERGTRGVHAGGASFGLWAGFARGLGVRGAAPTLVGSGGGGGTLGRVLRRPAPPILAGLFDCVGVAVVTVLGSADSVLLVVSLDPSQGQIPHGGLMLSL